jgi:tetratricopeptide (TPR) repeat protein
VLTEKLAEYYQTIGKKESAAHTLAKVLNLDPSPQQRVRVTFTLAHWLAALGKGEEAFDLVDQFYKATPWYPNLPDLCQQLDEMARKLNKPAAIERYDAELKRLTSAPNK